MGGGGSFYFLSVSTLHKSMFQFSRHENAPRSNWCNFRNTNSHRVLLEPVGAPRSEIISLKWDRGGLSGCCLGPRMERQSHSEGEGRSPQHQIIVSASQLRYWDVVNDLFFLIFFYLLLSQGFSLRLLISSQGCLITDLSKNTLEHPNEHVNIAFKSSPSIILVYFFVCTNP